MDRFESILFKLEVLDLKARERAGVITPTLCSPIPVLLRLDATIEVKLVIIEWVFTNSLLTATSYGYSVRAFTIHLLFVCSYALVGPIVRSILLNERFMTYFYCIWFIKIGHFSSDY